MSNKDQWTAPYTDAVNEGILTKKGIAGQQPTKSLGGSLRTAQGGDAPSPNGADAGSLSVAGAKHGTVLANADPFITSIGVADLPDASVNESTVDGVNISESYLYSQDATGSGTSAATSLTTAFNQAGEADFALSFTAAYAGATTASNTFYAASSPSGVAAGGSGWTLNGTNITFTNGSLVDFADAVASGTVPASGATFYAAYDISYTQLRGVQAGQVGVLSLGAEQKDVRVGNSVFGSGRFGVPEVSITTQTGGGLVDMPTSKNIGVTETVRNVGSRFSR